MSNYTTDPDLEFLKFCKNDDLDILVEIITKNPKDKTLRLTEDLTLNPKYKQYYPNHKFYWDLIAAEIQTFGGSSLSNILRGSKGVLYKEILCNVCNKMKVNYNKESTTEFIEMNLLQKVLTDSMDKMNKEDLENLVRELKLKTTNYTSQSVTLALQSAIKLGGFASYQVAVVVANSVAKTLLGRGLSFAVNAGLTRTIGIFAGPIGWIISGLWTVLAIQGPAYRVTIPSCIMVAYMRAGLTHSA